MPVFDDALAKLPESLRVRVEQCLVIWASHPEWGQIVANLRAEVALRLEDFEALLMSFAEALDRSPAPLLEDAWRGVCAQYEFRGAEMPATQRPGILGRGGRVAAFAAGISARTRGLSSGQAERIVRKHAGRLPPSDGERVLRAGTLGGRVIWATFNVSDGNVDPFAGLPSRRDALCTALGLGHHLDAELLVLTYRSEAPTHGKKLCRPTVADASAHTFYRPHSDVSTCWGYTKPLELNPDGLEPMPEVVHAQVDGAGLIFPYQILV